MSRGSQIWVSRVIIEPFIFHLHDHRPGVWISVEFLAYIHFSNEEGLYWLVNRDTFWKMLRGSALLTCQARTRLKRRRTGASYCQGVVEGMRLEGVPASLGFCTCRYYHPLNTWSTVLPSPEYLERSVASPLEYLDHGTLWPEFISFCSWREEGRGDGDSCLSRLILMRKLNQNWRFNKGLA